jgi:hypothetical protein
MARILLSSKKLYLLYGSYVFQQQQQLTLAVANLLQTKKTKGFCVKQQCIILYPERLRALSLRIEVPWIHGGSNSKSLVTLYVGSQGNLQNNLSVIYRGGATYQRSLLGA